MYPGKLFRKDRNDYHWDGAQRGELAYLRRAEERASVNQRLADVGQLTGTIAHEIRNPLATIGSSVYYLDIRLKDTDEKIKQHLERIKYSVELATSIIEGIRSQTRLREPELAPVDLREVLKEAVSASNVPENISLSTDIPDEKVIIDADRSQLLVALPNILRNGIEAMPQARGKLEKPGNNSSIP